MAPIIMGIFLLTAQQLLLIRCMIALPSVVMSLIAMNRSSCN